MIKVFGIAICLYIIIFGIYAFFKSRKSMKELKNLLKSCEVKTKGKIVDVVEGRIKIRPRSGRKKQQYHKIYEYEAGSQIYREKSTYEYDGGIDKIWEKSIRETIGKEEDLYFNPSNPKEFYIYQEIDNEILKCRISSVISIVTLVLGIGFLIVFQAI